MATEGQCIQAKASGKGFDSARYLFVGKQDITRPERSFDPPELRFARQQPQRFLLVFENDAASVFEVAK